MYPVCRFLYNEYRSVGPYGLHRERQNERGKHLRSQILEFHFCLNCTALMPLNAAKCARCGQGTAPAPLLQKCAGRLKSVRADRRERRYGRKNIPLGLCPNCRTSIPHGARRCGHCNWASAYANQDKSTARHRRLFQTLRTTLRYEKILHCTFCACAVRTATNVCPLCLNPFQSGPPRLSRLSQIGTRLRLRKAKIAVEQAALCPTCDIYVPDWSESCYCCGWVRPLRTDAGTVLRSLLKSTKRKADLTVRMAASCLTPGGELCPTCEVCIPTSDRMCMICGWKPVRAVSLREALTALRAERSCRAKRGRQEGRGVCEDCDLPILPGDALCMVCGWKPVPGTLQRILAVGFRPRKAVTQDDRQQQCPNCLMGLDDDAQHCDNCAWTGHSDRPWIRRPQVMWLLPICLVLFCSFTMMLLQMANTTNSTGDVDRYGRTGAPTESALSIPNRDGM